MHTPAISRVHAVLDRYGLVKRRMGRRNGRKERHLSLPGQPDDLWRADYKGEFMLADRRYVVVGVRNHLVRTMLCPLSKEDRPPILRCGNFGF